MDDKTKELISYLSGPGLVAAFLMVMPAQAHAQTEAEEDDSETTSETSAADSGGQENLAVEDNEGTESGEDGVEDEERIVVTGSRVARSNLTTPIPVTVVDYETLRSTGEVFLGDVLSQLPQFQPSFTTANSRRFIGTQGGAPLNLRGLGTARTLTLVNGRRHIGGSALSTAVDVNTIPQDLIERIDVLTGGASAVYGSDALAGVVNFVLRDDFEGLVTRSQFGVSERGDAQNWFVSTTVGSNFAEGAGNAALSIEYNRRQALFRSERDFSNTPGRFVANPDDNDEGEINDGVPDEIIAFNAGANTITVPGIVFARDPERQGTFNPDGSFRPFDFGVGDPALAAMTGEQIGGDFLNLAGPGVLIPRTERIMATALLSYNLTDWAEFYGEAKLVLTDTSSPGTTGAFDFNLPVQRDNAFLPTGLGAVLDEMGVTTTGIARVHQDLGLRTERVDRFTLRTAAGIKGEINENVAYDVGVTWGQSSLASANGGNRVNARFFAATDAVVDTAGEVNGNPGEIVCRVSLQQARGEDLTLPGGNPAPGFAADGCVPTSIFGEGAINDGAREFSTVPSGLQPTLEQVQVMGFATLNSANYLELPGGPLALVVGSEYRRDQSRQSADSGDSIGLTFFNAFSESTGVVDVGEVFGELVVPVVAGLPGVEELTLQAGGRLSRYNLEQVGTVYSASLSGLYRPTEDVTLRGSFSRALRSPDVGDAFLGQTQDFGFVADPCDDQNIVDAGPNRIQNCIALAERVGFAGFEPETTDIPDQSTRELLAGGNPDLEEERSRNWTVGGVINPQSIPGLVLSADYYNFRIKNAIGEAGEQRIADNCVDLESIDNQFCDLITRDPENLEITLIENITLNLAAIEVEGVDFAGEYAFDVEDAAELVGMSGVEDLGRIRLRLNGNHLIRYTNFPDQNDLDERQEEAGFAGRPQWRLGAFVNYYFDALAFTYRMNWLDGFSRLGERADLEDNPDAQQPLGVRSKAYHGIQLSYQLLDQIEVYGGVNNLLDTQPPLLFTGTGAVSGFYENIGRNYYFGTTINY